MPTSKTNDSQNIAKKVYEDLRKQILDGSLSPGERLPGERELAARYGTNRNTLREAVRRLEQMRLVTVRHGQGVTVADFRRTGTMDLLAPLFEASSDFTELSQIVHDILPARLLVLEFAGLLAVQRADRTDIERIRDITDLIISASESGNPVIIARGFQRWLEALIDAGHSVAMRWVANPFLASFRELLDRFPEVWVMDVGFPAHLRSFLEALEEGSEEKAVVSLRNYYHRIDGQVREGFNAIAQLASHGLPQAQAPQPSAVTNLTEAGLNELLHPQATNVTPIFGSR